MFDINFTEMLVIGIVALVVIGPEKLPRVARTIGVLLGRAQRYVSDIKSDINRQVQMEETQQLRELQRQVSSQVRAMEDSVKQDLKDVRSIEEELYRGIEPPSPAVSPSVPEKPVT